MRAWLTFFLAVLPITACVEVENPSSPSMSAGGPVVSRTVSGSVVLGPVSGARVRIYELGIGGARGKLLADGETTGYGTYELSISGGNGALLVEATGGIYEEEEGGQRVSNTVSLRAVAATGAKTIHVTPFTHFGAAKAIAQMQRGVSVSDAIRSVSAEIASDLDVDSLTETSPFAATYFRAITAVSKVAAESGTTSAEVSRRMGDFGSGAQVTIPAGLAARFAFFAPAGANAPAPIEGDSSAAISAIQRPLVWLEYTDTLVDHWVSELNQARDDVRAAKANTDLAAEISALSRALDAAEQLVIARNRALLAAKALQAALMGFPPELNMTDEQRALLNRARDLASDPNILFREELIRALAIEVQRLRDELSRRRTESLTCEPTAQLPPLENSCSAALENYTDPRSAASVLYHCINEEVTADSLAVFSVKLENNPFGNNYQASIDKLRAIYGLCRERYEAGPPAKPFETACLKAVGGQVALVKYPYEFGDCVQQVTTGGIPGYSDFGCGDELCVRQLEAVRDFCLKEHELDISNILLGVSSADLTTLQCVIQ